MGEHLLFSACVSGLPLAFPLAFQTCLVVGFTLANAPGCQVANDRFLAEMRERRRLHNQIAEMKGNIRVFCRVRPASAAELETGDGLAVSVMVCERQRGGGAGLTDGVLLFGCLKFT